MTAPVPDDPYQQILDRLPAARTEVADELALRCAGLDRLAPAARHRLVVATIRCPDRGCELGKVYEFDLRGGGQRYVFRGRTPSGRGKDGLLNWAYPDDRFAPVFFSTGCAHGVAKLGVGWLLDCVAAVRIWKHAMETEGQFLASLPPELAKGRTSRVFHPPGESWA